MRDVEKIKQIAEIPFSVGFVKRGKKAKIPFFEFARRAAARTKLRRHRGESSLKRAEDANKRHLKKYILEIFSEIKQIRREKAKKTDFSRSFPRRLS